MIQETNPVLEVRHLKKYFPAGQGKVLKAVDDVSFCIYAGETLGLVGESGCGKTTCGRTCAGLYGKTEGQVLFRGKDVHGMSRKEYRDFTCRMQTIFQDPYSSLDPKMKVLDIVAEGLRTHRLCANAKEQEQRVYELLAQVGLSKEHANRYVHEFSGGQRQRVGIARALAVEPEFIVCDEPISALDVSIQAQVMNLLKRLQREKNLTYLFIAHDLSMIKHISDRVAVMYLGAWVELAPTQELYQNPMHPYTVALLSAVPIANPELERTRQRILLEGDAPSPISLPEGCRFCGRCRKATQACRTCRPEMKEVAPGHFVGCFHPEEPGEARQPQTTVHTDLSGGSLPIRT